LFWGFNTKSSQAFSRGEITGGTANSIWKPTYSTLEESIKLMKKKTGPLARALSNDYWLLRGDSIQLFRRRAYCGSFVSTKFFANEDARIMMPELLKEIPTLVEYAKP
jgi:hypothetical protein